MVTHRRGPWSQTEDTWLVNLVHQNGPHNWVRISQQIQSRSPKQCRERYHQNLKPSLNHNPITEEEGEEIVRMVNEMGKRWAEIARRLNGRSDNAVKNWWNGGQHRRRRTNERQNHPSFDHQQGHTSQSPYVHPIRPALPACRDYQEPSYPQSRRQSLNPSPYPHPLPQPHGAEGYSLPPPLQLQSYQTFSRAQGYETPMPSPGYSVASVDAPSLVTDTGSDTRSPRGAPSPFMTSLPPMIGSREERRNSSTRYVPVTGFAGEDDDLSREHGRYKRKDSMQLPPLNCIGSTPVSMSFREPNYGPESLHLLTEPSAPTLPAGQHKLPSYQDLHLPTPQTAGTSPSSRHLPSPFLRPSQTGESRSAPTSPRRDSPRDDRMKVANLL